MVGMDKISLNTISDSSFNRNFGAPPNPSTRSFKNIFFHLFILFSFGIFLVSLGVYGLYHLYSSHASTKIISAVPKTTPKTPVVISPNETSKQQSLTKIIPDINLIAASYPVIDFGISVIDIKSGAQIDINGDEIFDGASTTKVLIACLLLSQVEEGKYSLDKKINDITLNQLLKQMVNRSDNDAWETLMDFIGFKYQTPYVKSIGINSYNVTYNKISPNDMALLLSKLYQGKLLNSENTKLLLSYMQNTNDESIIPPAVPKDIPIYHKYGSYNGTLHDAAIIDDGKNPFSLVVFSATGSGTLSYTKRIKAIRDITKIVEKAEEISIEPQSP